MNVIWLGTLDYDKGLLLQRELVQLRYQGEIGDLLVLLEHPPSITLGRGGNITNIVASSQYLSDHGVVVTETDRGGDVTYHGPGQLVGYPILCLSNAGRDVHAYLRSLEQGLINTLSEIGVPSRRFSPHTGVWVGDEKIAAIGVKVSKWVTSHGFALNVNPDMDHFNLIVPCGIRDYGVTSLHKLGYTYLDVQKVVPIVAKHMVSAFPGSEGGSVVRDHLSSEMQIVWDRGQPID